MLGAAGVGGVEGVRGRQQVAGGEAGALRGERREGGGGDAAGVEDDDVGGGAGAGERVQQGDGAGQVVGVGDEGDVGARVAGRRGRGPACRAWGSVGPEDREREGDRVEGRDADLLVVLQSGDQGPGAVRGARRLRASARRDRRTRGARRRRRRRCGACRSGRCARVPGLRTSQTQSGARSNQGASGQVGIRSRRQPARSGTSTSGPRCSSGSSRIHQPPGPPRPLSNGPPSSTPERRAGAGVARGRARMQVQRALDQLGDHVLRGVEDVLVGGRAADRGGVLVHGASLARRRRIVRRSSGRGARGRARRAGRSPWSRPRRRGCGSGRRGRRTSSPPRPPRSSRPARRVIGSRPRARNWSFLTTSSFSAASLRGLGSQAILAPVSSATRLARSRTRWVSVIWLKILTRSPRLGRVGERELDAADRVLDVDEGAGLAAGAVHGQRVADRGLDQEAVEHRAVVAVVVEAVDQLDVAAGLLGVGAPDDALVQVGDPEAVVLGVVLEQDLIEALGHVVDRAGAGRVEDLLARRSRRRGSRSPTGR